MRLEMGKDRSGCFLERSRYVSSNCKIVLGLCHSNVVSLAVLISVPASGGVLNLYTKRFKNIRVLLDTLQIFVFHRSMIQTIPVFTSQSRTLRRFFKQEEVRVGIYRATKTPGRLFTCRAESKSVTRSRSYREHVTEIDEI